MLESLHFTKKNSSVLPILSKPLERHVSVTYQKHLLKYNLLYKTQSVYRPNNSCENALININDRWLKEMDNGKLIWGHFTWLKQGI